MEKHTGRCVKQGGALYVEIDVTHLSTFVVVPTAAETVEEEEKIPEALLIVAVLAAAFWYGWNAPGLQGAVNQPPDTSPEETPPDAETGATPDHESSVEYSEAGGMEFDSETGKDKYQTAPGPEGKPLPVESQDAVFSDTAYTCTLSVRCDTILNNMDWLNPEKAELVPEDGVIFPTTTVTFYEGENVFNVLQRELKKAKIHMEFTDTPMYNSAYIEGINNLYEFDCGEQSGSSITLYTATYVLVNTSFR